MIEDYLIRSQLDAAFQQREVSLGHTLFIPHDIPMNITLIPNYFTISIRIAGQEL